MRTFVWLIGLLALIIALSASGTLSGNFCLKGVGCLNATGSGVSIQSNPTTGSTTSGAPAPGLRAILER